MKWQTGRIMSAIASELFWLCDYSHSLTSFHTLITMETSNHWPMWWFSESESVSQWRLCKIHPDQLFIQRIRSHVVINIAPTHTLGHWLPLSPLLHLLCFPNEHLIRLSAEKLFTFCVYVMMEVERACLSHPLECSPRISVLFRVQ